MRKITSILRFNRKLFADATKNQRAMFADKVNNTGANTNKQNLDNQAGKDQRATYSTDKRDNLDVGQNNKNTKPADPLHVTGDNLDLAKEKNAKVPNAEKKDQKEDKLKRNHVDITHSGSQN